MSSSPPSLKLDPEILPEKKETIKPRRIAKLTTVHVIHCLLIGLHAPAVVAAFRGWSFSVGLRNVALVQTGVTFGLQVIFIIIIGFVVALSREIGIDAAIRQPETLGLLHLRHKAWSGVYSSLSAYWLWSRSHSTLSEPEYPSFKKILLYLGCGMMVQISSGSIFATSFDAETSSKPVADLTTSLVRNQRRFGDFDMLWPTSSNLSSSKSTLFSEPSRNAAFNMFSGRTNDTHYPGLQGRLLHDTFKLDAAIQVPISKVHVNASLVNIHCSEVTQATINTFTLPLGSTDMSFAQPSPQDGQQKFLYQNFTDSAERGVWINVSMPTPPYWDPQVPGLNIGGYWDYNGGILLRTKVFLQPWAFPRMQQPIGHNQLVMVIATQHTSSIVTDSANGTGSTLNVSLVQDTTETGDHGGSAYIQVLGCTMKTEALTATIDAQGRLLDPLTSVLEPMGPDALHDDHEWDEFAFQSEGQVTGFERQFLLAFTPSAPGGVYNDTSPNPLTPIGAPESILAHLLDGELSLPLYGSPGPAHNALVSFQGALERLYASYLWNVNQLCSAPFDGIRPYCESYSAAANFVVGSPADFEVLGGARLSIVKWRAIVSLVACTIMWLVGSLLHPAIGRERQLRRAGVLDTARMLRGSSIPEAVETEVRALNALTERGLVGAVMTKRLRYFEQDDGPGGYLDLDDRNKAK